MIGNLWNIVGEIERLLYKRAETQVFGMNASFDWLKDEKRNKNEEKFNVFCRIHTIFGNTSGKINSQNNS